LNDGLLVRAWSRLTFAARLMLSAAVALGVAGAVLLVTSTLREADYVRALLDQELADAFATQLPALADQVVVGDYADIEQKLKAEVVHPDIRRLAWHAAEGGTVEAMDKPQSSVAPHWFVNWLDVAEPAASHALVIGGRDYGALTIEMSAVSALDRLWRGFISHTEIFILALGLDIVGILLILRYSLRPLRALIEGAGRFGRGELATRIQPQGSPEMRETILAFNYMAEDLAATLRELDQSRENLAITLQSIGDGVIATDCDGRVTELNQVAQHLTGWSLVAGRGARPGADHGLPHRQCRDAPAGGQPGRPRAGHRAGGGAGQPHDIDRARWQRIPDRRFGGADPRRRWQDRRRRAGVPRRHSGILAAPGGTRERGALPRPVRPGGHRHGAGGQDERGAGAREPALRQNRRPYGRRTGAHALVGPGS
jgi:PAS domain-containing protein